jgi:hypothetical protein
MRVKILFASALFAAGCARMVPVYVESTRPAAIDVNGITVCDRTPCEIELRCKDPVIPNYEWIEAVPLDHGFVQRKVIRPCDLPTESRAKIRFDPNLQPAAPRNTLDVNVNR